MNQTAITQINHIVIWTVTHDGAIFVPIKPVCEAIGIDYKTQHEKISGDEFLSPTMGIIPTVAADGKTREMVCLPLRYVYGWLATINPGKVAPEAREAVSQYRRECYNVLYNYFVGHLCQTLETNEAEIALLKDINAAISDEREAEVRRKKAEDALDKLRAERLNPQPLSLNPQPMLF